MVLITKEYRSTGKTRKIQLNCDPAGAGKRRPSSNRGRVYSMHLREPLRLQSPCPYWLGSDARVRFARGDADSAHDRHALSRCWFFVSNQWQIENYRNRGFLETQPRYDVNHHFVLEFQGEVVMKLAMRQCAVRWEWFSISAINSRCKLSSAVCCVTRRTWLLPILKTYSTATSRTQYLKPRGAVPKMMLTALKIRQFLRHTKKRHPDLILVGHIIVKTL